MNIFQIPKKNSTASDLTIGIIDCSGSMESNWPWLASHWNQFIPQDNSKIITFDTKAKIPPTNRLDADITVHGGGGTNITHGFVKLDQELSLLPKGSNVTIVFISDGDDNNKNTLDARMSELAGNDGTRRINFICIGVGAGFPTFISMKLREKYHNGDDTLPAIFLIEHISEKAYTIKFEAIKPFLCVGQKVIVSPPVCVFPWREYASDPFENAWVMTEFDTVEIDGKKVDVREHHLSYKGINELFRSWNQMINLESMKEGEKVDVRAKKTLQVMDTILEELKTSKGIDVFEKSNTKVFDTFFQKFEFLKNRRNFERVIWFYDDVKKISAGNTAGALSSFEAAKRIGLGTIVGKAAQKAFALKNIAPAEFEMIKNEFKELLKTHLIEKKENPNRLRTFLLEPNIDKVLDLCSNQLELFESFPLFGVPVRVVKTEQGQLDLNKIDVRFVAENMISDLSEIMQEEGGNLMITVKEGKQEAVNSVLPLFTKDDKDLAPFINSRLFKFHVSYDLIRDADCIVEQSHAALLTGLFGNLLKREKINLELVESILATLDLIQDVLPDDDLYRHPASDNLVDLIQGKQTVPNKPSSVKVLLNAFAKVSQNKISKEVVRNLVKQMTALELHEVLVSNPKKVTDAFTYKVKENKEGESKEITITKAIRSQFPRIRTIGDLHRRLAYQILNSTLNAEIEIEFIPSKIDKLIPETSDLQIYKSFFNLVGAEKLTDFELETIVLAVSASKKSDQFNFDDKTALQESKEQVKTKIRESINAEINKNDEKKTVNPKGKKAKKEKTDAIGEHSGSIQLTAEIINNPLYKSLVDVLVPEFRQFFKAIHKEVIPQTKHEIQEYCKKNGINFKNIQFSAESHLPIRTCAAKGCHFYMREMKRLDSHMGVWGYGLPKGFHMIVKNNVAKTAEEIYEVLASSHFSNKNGQVVVFDPAHFGKTKEEVMQYIPKLQDAYKVILKE